MKKVLIIGPIPEPTTGVSLANKVVSDNLSKHVGFIVETINTSYNKFDENLGSFSFSKFIFYLKLNLYVYKIFRNDIIYLTPGQTFFGLIKYTLYYIVSHLTRKEIITHIHGNYFGEEYRNLKGVKKTMFRIIASKTTKGIVLSESLTPNLDAFLEEKNIHVLYNFVEDYLFPSEEEVKAKTRSLEIPKIVFLSNLMEEKGILSLLEALEILEKEGFKYEAKIAGNIDANNKEKVLKYFNTLKHTSYCGVVKGQEKRDLLLWSNVFVLPTWYTMEGQPISILEAMATANLVLTTKHAGIPDIFTNNKNGFFVDKKNAKSIVSMIKRISENDDEVIQIQKNNFKEAKEKYKVKSFIDNAVTIFNT